MTHNLFQTHSSEINDYNILTILLEKFFLLLVKLGQRVLGDGPEVVVEDHLAEDGVTSEEPADVSVVTVTPSQEDHVWLTLNGGSGRLLNFRLSIRLKESFHLYLKMSQSFPR